MSSKSLKSTSNKLGLSRFSSGKVINMSYHSAFELDDDKKFSLKTKRSYNPGGSLLEQNCENETSTLTLAEARDVIKKYTQLLMDFEKLNKIRSIREEICLKQVYLLLLNLKNGTYDRTLNPYKFENLFKILGIDLTEE